MNGVAIQVRAMTLPVLAQRIQAAVQDQGLTANLVQEGDCLVVSLTGPICPDPLLAMVAVEAELKRSPMAGLMALRLYGHGPDEALASWMSVIDLGGYFAQQAALPAPVFALEAAEASRLACEAERNFLRHLPSPRLASPGSVVAQGGIAKQEHFPKTPLAQRSSLDLHRDFIVNHSSWFAQAVKDHPRLHELAKERQHYAIGTLSHYLAETLMPGETVVDLLPVRKRDRACGLIFTSEQVIAISQPSRRDSSGSLRSNHQGLKLWSQPWSAVHKVEIAANALRFHHGNARERFGVDLETPYYLRNAIPRDIPVRIVRELTPHARALETKTGMAMVAGVMFAIGSGFSVLNHVMQQRNLATPSLVPQSEFSLLHVNRLNASARPGEQPMLSASLPNRLSPAPADASMAYPQVKPMTATTKAEHCLNSFNAAAEPHAYATLNQITQTLQVNLTNSALTELSELQFNQIAAAIAQEILMSCQSQSIAQVVVTNGNQRYQRQRPRENLTSVLSPVQSSAPASGSLKLFER